MKRWLVMCQGLLLVLLLAPAVLAQSTAIDAQSNALALFRDAERSAAAGDAAGACTKYGQSYSLAPQLDALMRWAECLEQSGRLASAHLAYRDAGDLAERSGDARVATARARSAALHPRLSYLTIEVRAERVLPALIVERDGFRLGSSAWGVPMPIDPGSHTISVSARGYRSWSTTIEVTGDRAAPHVEVPLLELEPGPPAPLRPPAPATVAARPVLAPKPREVRPAQRSAVVPVTPDRSAEGTLKAARVVVPVLLGAAVAGTAAGIYYAVETSETLEQRDGICPSSRDCEPGTNKRLERLTNDAVASQRAEITCFVLAGTSAAIGVGLWLLAPRSGRAKPRAARLTPVVHPSGGALVLQGEL